MILLASFDCYRTIYLSIYLSMIPVYLTIIIVVSLLCLVGLPCDVLLTFILTGCRTFVPKCASVVHPNSQYVCPMFVLVSIN